MKMILQVICLLGLLSLSYNSYSDTGIGGDPGWDITIDTYDRLQNFYYFSIDDKVTFTNDKGKAKIVSCTSNVVFYDIDEDRSFNLFPDSFNGAITSFSFEKNYNDSLQKIEYNSSGKSYWVQEQNNFEILPREVNEEIFITTYSFEEDLYTLWTCNRKGEGLRALAKFPYFSQFSIDAFNEKVLIQKQDENGRWYIEAHSF